MFTYIYIYIYIQFLALVVRITYVLFGQMNP